MHQRLIFPFLFSNNAHFKNYATQILSHKLVLAVIISFLRYQIDEEQKTPYLETQGSMYLNVYDVFFCKIEVCLITCCEIAMSHNSLIMFLTFPRVFAYVCIHSIMMLTLYKGIIIYNFTNLHYFKFVL